MNKTTKNIIFIILAIVILLCSTMACTICPESEKVDGVCPFFTIDLTNLDGDETPMESFPLLFTATPTT